MPDRIDTAARNAEKLAKAASKAKTPEQKAKLLKTAIGILNETIDRETGAKAKPQRKAA